MHATPQDKSVRRDSDPQLNRAEQIIAQGGEPLLPEVGEVSYLLSYWQDIGLVGSGAMGAVRLSALELIAWQEGCCVTLAPWEFAVLREMSAQYIASLHEASKPECPAPYGDPLHHSLHQLDRDVIQKKVVGQFKAFMLAQSSQSKQSNANSSTEIHPCK
ncbi:hypothetical protein G3I67_10730 [Orrella sp. NBD-18]|uniref:Uncharacterized protein n=1 Tax=Sheuella amnicola TaxID=2707330 RepID=A0A6B2R0Y9_9BURK|nr:hypothetical protein [Sheuella amnicola]NDY83708.1 hypothetical protein [Sheuella amnicola]